MADTREKLDFHICKGEQGEICSGCGKRVLWCKRHNEPLILQEADLGDTLGGPAIWFCPKCKEMHILTVSIVREVANGRIANDID